MTLSTEQCIAVAEKVWGYKSTEDFIEAHKYLDDILYLRWERQPKGNEFYKRFAAIFYDMAVNSWQGFGRTVEAMGKRGYVFIADDVYIGFITESKRHAERERSDIQFMWSRQLPGDDLNNFIEETHLAALEIVNDSN